MVQFYDDYDKKYPNLVLEILEYFDFTNKCNLEKNIVESHEGAIYEFITKYKKPALHGDMFYVQPSIVERICTKLCEVGVMTRHRYGGNPDMDDFTSYIKNDPSWKNQNTRNLLSHKVNSLVYGFEYIYNYYKELVPPVLCEKKDSIPQLGTCFKLFGGIVTAKHCLEGSKSVSLKGYDADYLNHSKIYIHSDKSVDIAFISPADNILEISYLDEPKIMDEVLVMGYPKIPTFMNFLTAEKATVSAIEEKRFTITKGSIAAIEQSYLSQHKLALITARIQPGNSGGPVINSAGNVIAVASSDTTNSDGDYDTVGYGIATPITCLIKILNDKHEIEQEVNFKNWPT